MKAILLIFLFLPYYLYAEGCLPNGDTLSNTAPESSSEHTKEWLYNEFISENTHPDVPLLRDILGFSCGRGIVLTSNGVFGDSAYYIETHEDASEIRYRFILDTENLLSSFNNADELALFKFTSYGKMGLSGESDRHLTLFLVKGKVTEWEIRLRWFDDVNAENVLQKEYFDVAEHDFVDFEFFWNKINAYEIASGAYRNTYSQSGLRLTIGLNHKPTLMISPYDHVNATNNLIGVTKLGYKNANSSPAVIGDEIRILSPRKYVE